MSTLAMLAAESGQILAAAPQKAAPSGGQLVTGLVAVLLVAGAWYAKKHQGWDLPQMLYGFVVCVAVSATNWGDAIIGGVAGALRGLANAAAGMLG